MRGGRRGRLRAAHLVIATVTAIGCASTLLPAPASALPPQAAGAGQAPADTPGSEEADLPDGRGKQILTVSCTSCHDLREVTKFRGYYTRAQWHDIVLTMVDYGADVGKADIEVLVDYLEAHLGRKVTASTP